MLIFTRKTQVALEFLATYLWAFLVILVVIASLWYFGILSLSSFLPSRCTISPEIGCTDYKLGETDAGTGILRLKLKNNFPSPIMVASWETTSESSIPFSCASKPTTGAWINGEIRDVEFTGCNIKDAGFVLGEKGKVSVILDYYLAGSPSTFTKRIEGEIFTEVTTIENVLTQPECNDDTDNDDNGCIDYDGGDTGCDNPSDTTEIGGICPSAGGQSDPLNCFVSTACSDAIVFRLSALEDAHAEIPSLLNFDYKACCRSATDTLSNSCTDPDIIPLHLSANTDANVEKNTQPNFDINVCLSAAAGTVSCNYNANCLATETCLATISADTDAHVADCVTEPFATKICCSIS